MVKDDVVVMVSTKPAWLFIETNEPRTNRSDVTSSRATMKAIMERVRCIFFLFTYQFFDEKHFDPRSHIETERRFDSKLVDSITGGDSLYLGLSEDQWMLY
jgi:hypothetical protein